MKLLSALTTLLTVTGAVAPAVVQAQMFPPVVETPDRDLAATVTVDERRAAVDAILQALEAQYVFPERVPAMRDALHAAQAAGRYDVTDARAFADRVSQDLSLASGDGHLYLHWDSEQFAAADPASAEQDEGPDLDAVWDARFRAMNFGLTEQRLLPGRIRYLKISLFGWTNDEAGLAYDSAMRFLKGGDAVIIDLRGNGGGSHDAVRYVLSHFMEPDELLITFLEAGQKPYNSRTLTHLPAGRMVGKPLYVLVDGRAASAGEEFAYSVQQFGLGTLIGETTAGGANNNRFVPVGPGFMLSVSYGQPVHPRTGSNWEGVGVRPDIQIPADQALEHAQTLAREALAAAR